MKRALAVGGSGMLTDATLWLAENGYHVHVVGRTEEKMNQLLQRARNITPVYVDYQDVEKFQEVIKQTFDWGIDLVLVWIHNVPENPLEILLDEASRLSNKWDLFHVLGSSSELKTIKKSIATPKNCDYHQVQLGFMIEKDGEARWLTHEEISSGVIKAIKEQKDTHVIGQLEPWEKRP